MSNPPSNAPADITHQEIQQFRQVSLHRMGNALQYIYRDIQKNASYEEWKMVQADALLQHYQQAIQDLGPNTQGTITSAGLRGAIAQGNKKFKIERDVEYCRSTRVCWNRAKFIYGPCEQWKRVGMVICVGTAVLVPMIVITKGFPDSVNASIVIVCVSTVVFAVFAALIANPTPHELMGVVASYAAVLAVFVGVSSPRSS